MSAACSHHPTARVGHSRGFTAMHVDESVQYDGRAQLWDVPQQQGRYSINVGLYDKSRGGDDGQEDTVATPEVHQRGEDVRLFSTEATDVTETRWKKDISGPLRTTGIARGPPLRGGLMCKVY